MSARMQPRDLPGTLRHILLALACLAGFTASTEAADEQAYSAAMRRADELMRGQEFLEAQQEYIKARKAAPSKYSQLSAYEGAADAAFLRGDVAAAREYYSLEIAETFDRELEATAGDPLLLRLFAASAVVVAAAGDVQSAQLGQQSTHTQEVMAKLPAFDKAERPKEYRRLVKNVTRSLRSPARKKQRLDGIPVDPRWNEVPGAGVAQLMTGDANCPALRVSMGVYVASSTCLSASDTLPALPWLLVHSSGLRPSDVCVVDDFWSNRGTQEPAGAGPSAHWVVFIVRSDCSPFESKFGPRRTREGDRILGRLATVEYGDEHGGLVPIARICTDETTLDCLQATGHHALVWHEALPGRWQFLGFASPHSDEAVLSASDELEHAIGRAAKVTQQRKLEADVARESERRRAAE